MKIINRIQTKALESLIIVISLLIQPMYSETDILSEKRKEFTNYTLKNFEITKLINYSINTQNYSSYFLKRKNHINESSHSILLVGFSTLPKNLPQNQRDKLIDLLNSESPFGIYIISNITTDNRIYACIGINNISPKNSNYDDELNILYNFVLQQDKNVKGILRSFVSEGIKQVFCDTTEIEIECSYYFSQYKYVSEKISIIFDSKNN